MVIGISSSLNHKVSMSMTLNGFFGLSSIFITLEIDYSLKTCKFEKNNSLFSNSL